MIYRCNVRRELKKAAKRGGVDPKKANWNVLRHTFASQLVSQGVSIFKVSKWLGHSSVVTTEQNYAFLIGVMGVERRGGHVREDECINGTIRRSACILAIPFRVWT